MGSIDGEIVDLGVSTLDPDTNVQRIQGKGPALSDDPSDAKSYDDVPVMSQLGVTAIPYPSTPGVTGAQGLMLYNIAGASGILVGARDHRSAAITGALKPGDTCVHSTGPNRAAQLQLKEKGRQCYLTAKTADGEDIVHLLDASAEQLVMAGFNYIVEMKKGRGITIANGTGNASIQLMDDGTVWIQGSRVLLGSKPTGVVVTAAGNSVGGVFA